VSLVVQCPRLSTSNADLNSTDTEFGVTVNITCLPGYIISSQTTAIVHCDSTGQWSLNASCLRKWWNHCIQEFWPNRKQIFHATAVLKVDGSRSRSLEDEIFEWVIAAEDAFTSTLVRGGNNNNNNNNTNDNIYGAVIVAKATARVHPVHMMNMAPRQAAADPQTRPNDPGCESACRLPETTPTVAIYYYYSESWYSLYRPTEGRRLSRPRHCSKGAQPVPKVVYRSDVGTAASTGCG